MRTFILCLIMVLSWTVSFGQEEGTEQEEGSSFQVEGYLDMYYLYNFNRPDSRTNETRVFDYRHNSLSINQLRTNLIYSAGKLEIVGDIGVGPGVSGANYGNVGIGNSIALNRAFMRYKVNDRVTVTAGQYRSHIGTESFSPAENLVYSVSYQFNYGPFYHTGIKMDFNLNEDWRIMAGIVNGWDEIQDQNQKKNITLQVNTTFIENVDLTLSWIGGDESSSVSSFGFNEGSFTSLLDFVGSIKISDSFTLATNSSFGSFRAAPNSNFPPLQYNRNGNWWAVALYAYYFPSENLSIALRNEYFKDPDDYRPVPESLSSITFTVDYKVNQYFSIKPELRIDIAENEIFEGLNGATNTTQPTLGVALLASIK